MPHIVTADAVLWIEFIYIKYYNPWVISLESDAKGD